MVSYLLSTSGLYTLKFSGQIISFKLDFKNSKWKSKWHFGNFEITWFRTKILNFSFGKIFKLLFIWRFISKWSDSTAPMILTNILRPQKHFIQTPVLFNLSFEPLTPAWPILGNSLHFTCMFLPWTLSWSLHGQIGLFYMGMTIQTIQAIFLVFGHFFSDIYLYWIDCRWMTSQLNFQKLILVKLLLFNMRLKFSVGSIGLGWSEGGGVGADGRCWWRWWRRGRQISRQEMISLMKVNLGGTLGSHIKWPIHTLAIIMRIYGWIVFISIANTCTWFLSRFQ